MIEKHHRSKGRQIELGLLHLFLKATLVGDATFEIARGEEGDAEVCRWRQSSHMRERVEQVRAM